MSESKYNTPIYIYQLYNVVTMDGRPDDAPYICRYSVPAKKCRVKYYVSPGHASAILFTNEIKNDLFGRVIMKLSARPTIVLAEPDDQTAKKCFDEWIDTQTKRYEKALADIKDKQAKTKQASFRYTDLCGKK